MQVLSLGGKNSEQPIGQTMWTGKLLLGEKKEKKERTERKKKKNEEEKIEIKLILAICKNFQILSQIENMFFVLFFYSQFWENLFWNHETFIKPLFL